MKHFISLGGGIQSTAMTLMACHGILKPKPIAAVFADTGWEREQTYENIQRLTEYTHDYGIDVITVKHGNLQDDPAQEIPLYFNTALKITTADGNTRTESPKPAMMRRQCTFKYKIDPIKKLMRYTYNAHHTRPVTMWIGISMDEVQRMKPSHVKYMIHRYPLIENRVSREDCNHIFKKTGYTQPVKSACIGCPYRSNAEWAELTQSELNQVIDYESNLKPIQMNPRKQQAQQPQLQLNGILPDIVKTEFADTKHYLHRNLKPMKTIPFISTTDITDETENKDEECTGACFL